MIRRLADLAVSTTFAGSLLLANTSCATHHPDAVATPASRSGTQAPGGQRLVQLSFGTQASFGVCVEPACPAVTPKTLAMASAAPLQAAAHRVASTTDAMREAHSQTGMVPVSSPADSAPAKPVDRAIHNLVVVFPFASAQLTVPARTALSAAVRHAHQSERILISGRTDAVGNDQVNESLALARALSVRNHLLDLAPDLAAVISIDARGRCCFVAPNGTQQGRSMNRRVEIAFLSQGGG
jgi:outer membrane protein OmpA-like peptidoglycan-associated protein